ncbi:MAG: LpqB family beta-propeller domain-containing protein [Propionicimonas sp.]|uniref:GerMN domain-containing protein n=1 Tax=Propionicimonas sp. TaxID=1955623 RepID=UPI003D13C684
MSPSGSRPRPRRGGAAALACALVVLSGCATVPTSGDVAHHTPQASGVNSGVQVDPLPPADGASQLLVVEGFLHAMGTYQPDYRVARQYLTEAASATWDPESGVQVYADGSPPTETEQSVVLSARVTGKVDAAGTYTPVGNDAPPLRQDFGLVKNSAGQWRISSPPAGLLVSRYAFTTGFVAVTLHFTDPAGSVLVPEPRFFAAGDQALEAAVNAQLAGPGAWLAPAVRKTETKGLTVDAVEVDSTGMAEVELGGDTGRLTSDEKRTLLAELTYTLSGFSQVSTVQVTADGEAWRDDAGQSVVRTDSFAGLAPVAASSPRTLFVVKDRKVQRLKDMTDWDDLAEVSASLAHPEQVAVNADLSEVAATSQSATRLQVARTDSDKVTLLRTGAGLLRPDYARDGELWSPAEAGVASLQVFKGEQRLKVTLGAEPVPTLKVRALSLSPDGTRVALILADGSQTRLGLATVERGDGEVTVSGWRPLDLSVVTGSSGTAIDVGWVTATELVVLQASDEGTNVFRVSQDGASSTDIGPSENLTLSQLAVVPQRPVAALSPTGNVYRRDGEFNWNLAIASVDAVAWSG